MAAIDPKSTGFASSYQSVQRFVRKRRGAHSPSPHRLTDHVESTILVQSETLPPRAWNREG